MTTDRQGLEDPTPDDRAELQRLDATVAVTLARVRNGIRTTLAALGDPGNCRSCGSAIYWCRTKRGSRMPVDPEGTSHFATCPDADEHRRPR